MALAAELWTTAVKREREKELLFIGRQFRDAIGRYYEATPGSAKQYPVTLDDLISDARYPQPRRHLRKVYLDPMTGNNEWGVMRLGGRIVGIHSLSDAAPMKTAGFLQSEGAFQSSEKYSDWVFTYPTDLVVKAENTPKIIKSESGFGASSNVKLHSLPDTSKKLKNEMFNR